VSVYHRRPEALEFAALERAKEGVAFGAVCETFGEALGADAAVGAAFDLLGRWVADELLSDTIAA
jgi:hypothetical protein